MLSFWNYSRWLARKGRSLGVSILRTLAAASSWSSPFPNLHVVVLWKDAGNCTEFWNYSNGCKRRKECGCFTSETTTN
jgi:hypothetical protein